jgi:hypothetical protein
MFGHEILGKIVEVNPALMFAESKLLRSESGFGYFLRREPGCLESFSKGLAYLIENIDKTLSVELITSTHQLMMEFKQLASSKPGQFRCGSTALVFNIPPQRSTEKGIAQLKKYVEQYNGQQCPRLQPRPGYEGHYLYMPPFAQPVSNEIQKAVEKIVHSFNQAVKKFTDTTSIKDKVRVFAEHIKRFELLHPFADGNGRVFVNGLLNWMLIKHGLPPALFEESNIFDAYCVGAGEEGDEEVAEEELTEAIMEACYASCYKALFPDTHLYGVNIDSKSSPDEEGGEISTSKQTILNALPTRSSLPQDKDGIERVRQSLYEALKINEDTLLQIVFSSESEFKLTADMDLITLASKNSSPFCRGRNALHVALLCGKTDLAQKIIKQRPESIRIQDKWGYTPLICAIRTQNRALIECLMPNESILPIYEIQQIIFQIAMHWGDKNDSQWLWDLLVEKGLRQLTQEDWSGVIKQAEGSRYGKVVSILKEKLTIYAPPSSIGKFMLDVMETSPESSEHAASSQFDISQLVNLLSQLRLISGGVSPHSEATEAGTKTESLRRFGR